MPHYLSSWSTLIEYCLSERESELQQRKKDDDDTPLY